MAYSITFRRTEIKFSHLAIPAIRAFAPDWRGRLRYGIICAVSTEAAFQRLAKSKFRSRFRLSEADRTYIAAKGIETVRRHCEDFIRTRLAPANPPNDGRQTPMRGHPVFKAQHACACCCRDCLLKWWKVPKGTDIPPERQSRIVDFLMAWIDRQLNNF